MTWLAVIIGVLVGCSASIAWSLLELKKIDAELDRHGRDYGMQRQPGESRRAFHRRLSARAAQRFGGRP